MATRTARRAKEHAATYATRTPSRTRPSRLYPQARYLTRQERRALKAYQDYLLNKFPDHIERIVLFGSKARGDSTPASDLDVLVIVRSDESDFQSVEERWREITTGAYEIGFHYGLDISVKV
ncbi:MAG: nucleotidyltransferase domain-containing protein, partial [Anaerolineae bacterium]|nr:nucleotidyltransferase domain-containing protein [Anaerolineae bacterium]